MQSEASHDYCAREAKHAPRLNHPIPGDSFLKKDLLAENDETKAYPVLKLFYSNWNTILYLDKRN